MPKTFVLDTNVLLHNADALFAFAEHTVIIPLDVLEELDKFKTHPDDLGRNARQTIRHLDALRQRGRLADGVDIERNGKKTGGRVRVDFNGHDLDLPHFDGDSPDNRIIRTAYKQKVRGGGGDDTVTLVSKDINCRIKADVLGIRAEDFENQKIDFDALYTGWRELTVGRDVIDAAFAEGGAALGGRTRRPAAVGERVRPAPGRARREPHRPDPRPRRPGGAGQAQVAATPSGSSRGTCSSRWRWTSCSTRRSGS